MNIFQFFPNRRIEYPIIIMICFARSGGTLLNRILGVLDETVVLSEVNPLGSGKGNPKKKSRNSIQSQSWHWYKILIFHSDFFEAIKELHIKCSRLGKRLIVRDWTYLNFSRNKHNQNNPPNSFLLLDGLEEVNNISFALVRDAIDVWISMKKPNLEKFSKEYLRFAIKVHKHKLKLFKYEDLCKNPDKTVQEICEYIDIPFSKKYKQFYKFTNVNGDSQNTEGKFKKQEITFTVRKYLTREEIKMLYTNKDIIKANKLFGYDTNYFTNGMTRKLYNKMSSHPNH